MHVCVHACVCVHMCTRNFFFYCDSMHVRWKCMYMHVRWKCMLHASAITVTNCIFGSIDRNEEIPLTPHHLKPTLQILLLSISLLLMTRYPYSLCLPASVGSLVYTCFPNTPKRQRILANLALTPEQVFATSISQPTHHLAGQPWWWWDGRERERERGRR